MEEEESSENAVEIKRLHEELGNSLGNEDIKWKR